MSIRLTVGGSRLHVAAKNCLLFGPAMVYYTGSQADHAFVPEGTPPLAGGNRMRIPGYPSNREADERAQDHCPGFGMGRCPVG